MDMLREEGQDAFLKHFYSKVTMNPLVKKSKNRDDVSTIQRRAVMNKRRFEERQAYQKCQTMEGKKRCLEMGLLTQTILKSVSNECHCETCNVNYTLNVIENSEACGLLYSHWN